MPHLRFAPEAEAQLQLAHRHLATSARQSDYDRIVSTLASLERDAALFTLLEASTLPIAEVEAYGVVHESTQPGRPIAIIYGLAPDDDEVVIPTIRW